MSEKSTKRKQFKQALEEIDVGVPFDVLVADDLASVSPISSLKGENLTPVNLNSPFPDLSFSEDNDSKLDENDDDIYQPPPSPIFTGAMIGSPLSEFDNDIKSTVLDLVEDNSINPEIHIFIVNQWFDLTKSEPGAPGIKLADLLNQLPKEKLSEIALNQIFDQLDDLRTTIKTQETAILFYQSSISLLKGVSNNSALLERCCDMCNKSISTASKIIGDPMFDIYKEALGLVQNSDRLSELSKQLMKTKEYIIKNGG